MDRQAVRRRTTTLRARRVGVDRTSHVVNALVLAVACGCKDVVEGVRVQGKELSEHDGCFPTGVVWAPRPTPLVFKSWERWHAPSAGSDMLRPLPSLYYRPVHIAAAVASQSSHKRTRQQAD